MTWLPDTTLDHLREVAERPDLAGTPYELQETIGRGGMAVVYRAYDRELEREVALKVLAVAELGRAEAAERLRREARVLARLEHPGIVPVHGVGELPDGRIYYAMRLVRGERLDERAGRPTAAAARLRDLLGVFERICEAVAYAHAHGVLHRDLKPENVMVGPWGEVLVMDWGLAKLGGRTGGAAGEIGPGGGGPAVNGSLAPIAPTAPAGATGHGTVLGTPGYMPPEQAAGEVDRLDARADVYALGGILAFLLAGHPPPTGGEPDLGGAPPALAAICRKALAGHPADRYASAGELAAEVSRFRAGDRVEAYPESAVERAARWARRHRVPLILVGTYLLMRVVLLLVARL